MAVYETNRSVPAVAVGAFRITTLFERLIKMVRAKIVADRTHSELSRLSPAQLRDIGLGDQDLGVFCRDMANRGL